MVTLKVFVEEDCWSCAESHRLVNEIAPEFPDVVVELIDLATGQGTDDVFVVPTYMLDDKIISLGNPYPRELRRKLKEALNAR